MRDFSRMALVVTDNDRPTPKVWQPWAWYLEGGGVDDMRKDLPSRAHREQRIRERLSLDNALRHSPSPEINVVDNSPVEGYLPLGGYYVTANPHIDDDLPLDMSTKRRYPTPPPVNPATHATSRSNFPLTPPPAHSVNHANTPPPLYIIPGTPPLQPPPPAHTPSSTCSSSPPPYTSTHLSQNLPPPHPPGGSRGRPSVITCASPRYLPPLQGLVSSDGGAAPVSPYDIPQAAHQQQQHHPGVALPPPSYEERSAPPPSYSAATAHLREHNVAGVAISATELSLHSLSRRISATAAPHSPSKAVSSSCSSMPSLVRGRSPSNQLHEDQLQPRRKVVQASPADPDIDEHFRRSLGHNYQQLFLNKSEDEDAHDSNDSVDDHFAKALGDTWVKIKAGTSSSTESFRGGSAPKDSPSAASLLTSPCTAPSSPTLVTLGGRGSSPPPLMHKKLLSAGGANPHRLLHSRSHSPPSSSTLKISPPSSSTLEYQYRSNPDVSITRVTPTAAPRSPHGGQSIPGLIST